VAGHGAERARQRLLDAARRIGADQWFTRSLAAIRPASPGVLNTLARAARRALNSNPHVKRLALTAPVQGFRDLTGAKSTVERLSELVRYGIDHPRGVAERRDFAERMPTVVVMVDEIAGDDAGNLCPCGRRVVASRVHRPILCRTSTESITVVLVLADASPGERLGAHQLLIRRHRSSREDSGLELSRPTFRSSTGRLRLGERFMKVLHVMADWFPASNLTLDYHVKLTPVLSKPASMGPPISPRIAIRVQQGEAQVLRAVEEIFATTASGSAIATCKTILRYAEQSDTVADARPRAWQRRAPQGR
jgi:hypothetical protein